MPGLYRHFKGGKYELLNVARHSETKELLAVYRSVEDQETIWVRPLEMFTEAAAVETGSNTCTGEHAISSLLSQNLKGLPP